MCFPKHHRRRTPDAETGENRPLPRQLRRGEEHVLRWCDRQVQGPDVSHKICGNDTNLPSRITLVKSNLQNTCAFRTKKSKSRTVPKKNQRGDPIVSSCFVLLHSPIVLSPFQLLHFYRKIQNRTRL